MSRWPRIVASVLSLLFAGEVHASSDSDGDGLGDAFELFHGFDPLDPDEDANGRLDGLDDPDADHLANRDEERAGTNPLDPDSDDDGLLDRAELGQGDFGPAQVVSDATAGASSVIGADLDGDGDADLVTTGQFDATVAWHENQDGAGDFGPRQVITAAILSPQVVVAADVDRDGDLDLVSGAFGGSQVSWHENLDDSGNFGAPQVISTPNGTASVLAADLDGDLDPDVAAVSFGTDVLEWYRNDAASFGAANVISAETIGGASIQAADLDADGDLDLLAGSILDDRVAWFENLDGLGDFGERRIVSNTATQTTSVAAADIDGDGDLDAVAAARGADAIVWYENTDGVGAFASARPVADDVLGPQAIDTRDVDGDGDTDVLSASILDGRVAWHENVDGDGTFAASQALSVAPDAGPLWIAAVDVDHDGDPDAVSALQVAGRIEWHANRDLADPLDPDTDDDGLCDGGPPGSAPACALGGEDANGNGRYDPATETDPGNPDTDGDGFLDGQEIRLGSDPLDAADVPAVQVPALPAAWAFALGVGIVAASRRRLERAKLG